MKSLIKGVLWLAATILAAIAVVLPWDIRIKYSAFLRWLRDLFMQNSQAVRRWALKERWSWDTNEQ
jgi:hypothetical protein